MGVRCSPITVAGSGYMPGRVHTRPNAAMAFGWAG